MTRRYIINDLSLYNHVLAACVESSHVCKKHGSIEATFNVRDDLAQSTSTLNRYWCGCEAGEGVHKLYSDSMIGIHTAVTK